MIVCFGSINLDLIFPLPALPQPGQTVLGRAMRVEPGGKGANQAVAAARDGAAVAFAGAVGQDGFAAQALVLLQQAGVDLSRVVHTDTSTGAAAICVDPHGANQIAVAAGANLLARADQVEVALLGPDTTLLLQCETDLEQTVALIHRARAGGARVVLNLAPPAKLPEAALRAIDVLLVNEDEGAWIAASLATGRDAASLRASLGVAVVMTMGERGVAAATPAGNLTLDACKVAVVDTTAAGDCFAGVLAAGLDRGLAMTAAIRRANMAAAICCTRPGSQGSLPRRAEIDAALPG